MSAFDHRANKPLIPPFEGCERRFFHGFAFFVQHLPGPGGTGRPDTDLIEIIRGHDGSISCDPFHPKTTHILLDSNILTSKRSLAIPSIKLGQTTADNLKEGDWTAEDLVVQFGMIQDEYGMELPLRGASGGGRAVLSKGWVTRSLEKGMLLPQRDWLIHGVVKDNGIMPGGDGAEGGKYAGKAGTSKPDRPGSTVSEIEPGEVRDRGRQSKGGKEKKDDQAHKPWSWLRSERSTGPGDVPFRRARLSEDLYSDRCDKDERRRSKRARYDEKPERNSTDRGRAGGRGRDRERDRDNHRRESDRCRSPYRDRSYSRERYQDKGREDHRRERESSREWRARLWDGQGESDKRERESHRGRESGSRTDRYDDNIRDRGDHSKQGGRETRADRHRSRSRSIEYLAWEERAVPRLSSSTKTAQLNRSRSPVGRSPLLPIPGNSRWSPSRPIADFAGRSPSPSNLPALKGPSHGQSIDSASSVSGLVSAVPRSRSPAPNSTRPDPIVIKSEPDLERDVAATRRLEPHTSREGAPVIGVKSVPTGPKRPIPTGPRAERVLPVTTGSRATTDLTTTASTPVSPVPEARLPPRIVTVAEPADSYPPITSAQHTRVGESSSYPLPSIDPSRDPRRRLPAPPTPVTAIPVQAIPPDHTDVVPAIFAGPHGVAMSIHLLVPSYMRMKLELLVEFGKGELVSLEAASFIILAQPPGPANIRGTDPEAIRLAGIAYEQTKNMRSRMVVSSQWIDQSTNGALCNPADFAITFGPEWANHRSIAQASLAREIVPAKRAREEVRNLQAMTARSISSSAKPRAHPHEISEGDEDDVEYLMGELRAWLDGPQNISRTKLLAQLDERTKPARLLNWSGVFGKYREMFFGKMPELRLRQNEITTARNRR